MFEQPQIAAVHKVRASFVLFDVKRLGCVAFGFGDAIAPSARLYARAFVCAAPRKVGGQQTAAAVTHAHCAVNKRFELHIGHCGVDLFYFFKSQLSCKHNSFYAHALPKFDGKQICRVGLCGEVNREFRSNFFAKRNKAHVAYKHGVYACRLQKREIVFQCVEVVVPCKNICRDVNFLPSA